MKYILFASPVLLFLEIYIFSWVAELLRLPSDTAVIAGIVLLCVFIFGNYQLIKFIIKQFKKEKK
jgi:menaquinone-dependent protoporphyrinogen IX oxidase